MYNNKFDSLFNDFYDSFSRNVSTRVPPVDIFENEKGYFIEVELPGFTKEDVDLNIGNHSISIKTTDAFNKSLSELEDKQNYLIKESNLKQSFKRSFTFPKDVEEDKVKAQYLNGILRIAIPKAKQAIPKIIKIV